MNPDLAEYWKSLKKRKYRNVHTVVNGVRFDSIKEAGRWRTLQLLERAGKISYLQRQIVFPIIVEGEKICVYRADFVYEENGKRIIEDCKGMLTPIYRLKKKLLKATLGLEIYET